MKNLRDIAGHLVGCTYWQFYYFYYSATYFRWFRTMDWRAGQALVNLASLCQPQLARNFTTDKPYDPFYDDNKIPAATEWLEAHWPKENP